ncbi:branched-chain amino acid ABC transporter ATP-binding protein/permease [Embleya sp. NBC_00888]|uniref:branched-chain amino acid ABC transporter ATP-binding protein/permease n=1 Tax=Embleya sp. NBC_00888 TaxID=2975960 RepID=UPI00386EAE23|nr:branched-chain amino acid ABC transporter ATP-binding protein/permease [Embleya sp. NBC_00888]
MTTLALRARTALRSPRAVLVGRILAVAAIVWLFAAPYLVGLFTLILLSQALSLGVLAASVAVLGGGAGLPSLGQVAPYAVGGYTAAILAEHGMRIGVVHTLVAAAAGALFNAVTAPIVVRTRGVTVLMITLAVGELVRTAAEKWKSVTGGTDGKSGVPPIEPFWGMGDLVDDVDTYWYVLITTLVVIGITALVLRSPAGLLLDGARENETRMRATGHPVTRYLSVTYIGVGALAGVAGALLISVQRYISPAHIGFDTSSLVLLAVVIGGGASLVGAMIGAALIVFTRDWLSGPWPGHGPLLLGVLFLIAVYTLPGGLVGLTAGGSRAAWRALARAGGATEKEEQEEEAEKAPADPSTKPETVADPEALLTITGLTRRYGALAAVGDLDLTVRRGARHALLGPNGAGKSTVLGMVAGATPVTSGSIVFAGRDITRLPPARRSRLGIARAFQQPAVVPSLSVLDNVTLAAWRHARVAGTAWRPTRYRALAGEAATHLETVGLTDRADEIAGELSHGSRRLLDIAMALAGHPKLLLLDEPAAGLTDTDIERLAAVLKALPAEVTMVLVEHNFALVREVTDTVTVLASGQLLATGTPDEIAADQAVRDTYLGASEPEHQEVG